MNVANLSPDLKIPEDDGGCNHLKGFRLPSISLPNQDGNLLKLN